MLNDLQEALEEEMEFYEPEEIQQIQERAKKRAEEMLSKLSEALTEYVKDPMEENADDTSALYIATFVDRVFELIHNSAPDNEVQQRVDDVIKSLFG